MKALNFIEWLQVKQSIAEVDMGVEDKFSTGSSDPGAGLQRLANDMTTKAKPDTFSKVTTAPSKKHAQQGVVDVVKRQMPHLTPNQKKKFPMADIAKAVGANLGTDVMEK